jgi:hypothetical protein
MLWREGGCRSQRAKCYFTRCVRYTLIVSELSPCTRERPIRPVGATAESSEMPLPGRILCRLRRGSGFIVISPLYDQHPQRRWCFHGNSQSSDRPSRGNSKYDTFGNSVQGELHLKISPAVNPPAPPAHGVILAIRGSLVRWPSVLGSSRRLPG